MASILEPQPHPHVARTLKLLRGQGHLIVAIVALAALYVSVYGPFGLRLGLFADDFGELQTATTQSLPDLIRSWPLDYRPLEILPWIAAGHLAAMHLAWYYAGLFIVEALTGLLLYTLLYRWTAQPLLALGVSLIWATYPADESVFWLTTVAYRTGALFLLLAVILLTPPNERPLSRRRYAASIASALLCVGSNELYLGLLCALPIIAARDHASRPWRQRLGSALPFALIAATYTLYRVWFGPHVLYLFDNKGQRYEFSATHMVEQWITGWRAIAVITWQRVFIPSPVIAWVAGLACVGAAGLIALRIIHRRCRGDASGNDEIRVLRPGLIAIGTGVVAITAGYIPLLPVADSIVVNGVASRLNAAASLGAASALAGLLWVWCFALPIPQRWSRLLFSGLVALLLALTVIHTIRLGVAMNSITDHHPCGNPHFHLPCSAT